MCRLVVTRICGGFFQWSKAVKAAAQTFRANPKVNVEEVITQLGVGEALVSFLDALGGVLGGGGSRRGDTLVQAMAKSAARTMGSTVGRQIIRGVLGSILGGSSRK
jgi:hypothetical protein